jgi:7-carboxy-7-deazaguanine synthase
MTWHKETNIAVPIVDKDALVKINDMFVSLQGESKFVGNVCTFIRFQGCTNRCLYCDTPNAQDGCSGISMSVSQVIDYIKYRQIPLVEFTGGEPLLQLDALLSSIFYLLRDTEYDILVETNGNESIKPLIGPNPKLHIIMDIKTPSSGEHTKLNKENLSLLNPWDEVKMICSNAEDLAYAKKMLNDYKLPNPAIHPVWNGDIKYTQEMAMTIIEEKLPVRLGIQLHKLLNIA